MRASCWLVLLLTACTHAQPPAVTFTVDTTQARHPISPYIYGSNQTDFQGGGRNLTFTRVGGNRMTAYNWETNASNAGNDWHHQNDSFLSGTKPGEFIERAVRRAFEAKAGIVVTVPIAGYVAADKNGDGDVNKTPNFLETRFNVSLPAKEAPFSFPPDLTDHRVYQDEFVAWLEQTFPGVDGKRPPVFYCLDNEPALWSNTHARIHPKPVTYAELIQRGSDYAAAIKAVAPQALVFGPTEYGWQGFVNLQNAPDAAGRDFIATYLAAMAQTEKANGRRLLDVLDLHWYPEAQGGGERIVTDRTNDALFEARVQAPRSLWDPSYTEDSWISKWSTKGPIRLLPRMQELIARNYPGTRLALTEYCYGGGQDISGALAEADALGIYGREDLFAAALWQMSGNNAFIYAGFAMYRNVDGAGGSFGDTSVSARTSDVARTSVYAAEDAAQPGRLTLVCLNKAATPLPVELALTSPTPYTRGEAYQLTSASPTPQKGADVTLSGNHLRITLPTRSVSTLILHGAAR